MTMSHEEQTAELRARLVNANDQLRGMVARKYPDSARLAGKAEGVALALSYMDEIQRVNGPKA